MREIVRYADELPRIDESYRPFADHLRSLAFGYRSKDILNLATQVKSKGMV